MEMEYKRTWNQSVMVLKGRAIEVGYELEMLKHNEISGLLPIQAFIEEGKEQLAYDITGMKSFDSYIESRGVDGAVIRKLLENLIHLCRKLEKYLLDENHLILKQEMIFLNSDLEQMYFCYDSGREGELKKDFAKLLEELMPRLDHENKEETKMVYDLYERTQEENYSLLELQKLLFSIDIISREEEAETDDIIDTYEEKTIQLSKEKFGILKPLSIPEHKIKQWKIKGISLSYVDKLKEKIRKKKAKESNSIDIEETELPKIEELEETKSLVQYARLIYLGRGEERDFILDQPVFLIGRDKSVADGVLKSAAAGSIQAKVFQKNNSYYIEDMNSINGTLVNGELLTYKNAKKLEEGDRITFADISYRFLTFCHNGII